MPAAKKVKIDPDTARYYLALEAAFEKVAVASHVDPDAYLDFFYQFTQNDRYRFRCDLHDSWEAVVAKKEFKPKGIQTRRGIQ